ncbi:MAG: phytoene desaturase family protein [Candidatus Bathyarchaeia archaeon]
MYDVVIIGAGLGGLTSGAKMAKEGKKILLVEQQDKVGGCATVFHRKKNMTFETGLHEIDGLDEQDIKRGILSDLGVLDHVEFVRVPEFYRFLKGDVDVVVPNRVPDAIEAITTAFPSETQAIQTYFHDLMELRRQVTRTQWPRWKEILTSPIYLLLIRKLITFQKMTVGEYLDSLSANDELKMTLCANVGYYHDDPYSLSMLIFGLAQISYYHGGYYIKGGSQTLSDYLAKIITDNGGEIVLNHLVTEIVTEDGKAIGIRYIRKHSKDTEEQLAFGKIIVANTAIPNVVNHLIPSFQHTEYQAIINTMKKSLSLFTIYLSSKDPISSYLDNRYSTIVYDESVKTLHDIYKTEQSNDHTRKAFVIVDYAAIDSGINSEGSYIGAVCGVDYLENWEHLEKSAYRSKKNEIMEIYIKRLERKFPGITQHLTYTEMATPKTIQRYTLNPNGSVYGFAQTPDQAGSFRIRQKDAHIDNLYYASAWTFPGGGFTGAIESGYLCAIEILGAK